jgi:hypothetical protein
MREQDVPDRLGELLKRILVPEVVGRKIEDVLNRAWIVARRRVSIRSQLHSNGSRRYKHASSAFNEDRIEGHTAGR